MLTCRDYPARAGVMVYSDDDGLTWKAGENVPVRADWGSQNFNEPGIVELSNGKFWMYGRTTMGFHAQSWSDDRGMTWSTPEPTVFLGPCSPLTGEVIPETAYTKKMGWAGDVLFTFPNHDFERYPRRYTYTARTPLDSAISARRREDVDFRANYRRRPDRAVRLHEHHVSGRQGRRHASAVDDARAADSRRGPPASRSEVPVDSAEMVLPEGRGTAARNRLRRRRTPRCLVTKEGIMRMTAFAAILTVLGEILYHVHVNAAAEIPPDQISEIRKGAGGDYPWRVEKLTFENARHGTIRDFACLFTIPNYWPYAHFSSQTRCELPGKLFRARASGAAGDGHHYLSPAFWNEVNYYRMVDGRLYLAWRVKSPEQRVDGGRFSYVVPSEGPWKVWCNVGEEGKVVWSIELAA